MTDAMQWSRPLRWSAEVSAMNEDHLKGYLRSVRVGVRLEPGFDHRDARDAFLLAVNMLLRFCPRLVVGTDERRGALARKAQYLAGAILRNESAVEIATDNVQWNSFDAVLTVGRERLESERAVTINSNGWIARIGGGSGAPLPWRRTHAN